MASRSLPEPRVPTDDAELLRAFLRGRDAECPACGYNLRDLVESACPECAEPLALRVGTPRARIGWFLATITPGLFSVICAVLLVVPVVASGDAPPGIIALDAFGFLSGLAALALFVARHRFLQWSVAAQRTAAIVAWAVHVLAFAVVVAAAAAL